MNSVLRYGFYVLAGILALILAAALIIAQRLYASLPRIEGEMAAPGLSAETRIIRDEWGVPHIFAASDHDAFYAMGVVHAQDRLFQIDFTRRFVRGRLSEVLGEATLAGDARMRIQALGPAADAAYSNLPEEAQAAFQAYADGVNAVINAPGFVAPPEYQILRFSPEEWRPEDSAVVYKAIALDLFGGAMAEPARDALAEHLGEDRIAEFLGRYPAETPTSLSAEDLGLTPDENAPEPDGATAPVEGTDGRPRNGSNNWVVSGSRTVSGRPILANDPHLGLGAPSIWYLARLTMPDNSVVGVSLPGTPFITLGRNEHIAWGFTNTGPDTGDLQLVTDADITETIEETIEVRGGEPVVIQRRMTAIGPVLDPDYHSAARDLPDGQHYVLQSTLDEPDDSTPAVGLMIMKARNWEDFVEAARHFVVPQQNIVFASTAGDIGFYAPARLPIRDETGAWADVVPFEEMPHVHEPERGFVATANNKIVPDEYPHFITSDWYGVFRISSIWEGIEARERHDMASMAELQLDTRSNLATRILPALRQARPETEAGRTAMTLIRDWDGDLTVDSAAAAVYAAWMDAFEPALYADELGEHDERWGNGHRRMLVADTLTGVTPHWCDNIMTEEEESCVDILSASLDQAMAERGAAWGSDPAQWRYGDVHIARHDHPVFTYSPLLRPFFDITTEFPGDGSTVNVAHDSYRDGVMEVVHAASYRALYDFQDLQASQYIITTGQSGHFLSPHYDDQAPLWGRGEFITIRSDWTPETAPDGVNTLVLRPE